MRTTSVVNAAIAACISLATSGCVYIPPVGEQVRQEDTLFVKPGVTTRDEVLRRLGPPNILDGSRVSVYQWQTTPGWLIALFPVPNPVVPTSRSQSRLLLEFDDAGKVRHFVFAERPSNLLDPNLPRFFVAGNPQELQGPASRAQTADRSLPTCSQQCFALAVSRDGRQIALSLREGPIQVWDLKAGKGRTFAPRVECTSTWCQRIARAIDISPDGKHLAAAAISDTTVLWDMASGKQLHVLRGHGESTYATLRGPIAVAFAPDGRSVATGGFDGVVKLWDVASGKELSAFQVANVKVQSLAFAPEGDVLAVGTARGDVVVVALKSGKRLVVARGSDSLASGRSATLGPASGRSVAFSPTGETLAANSCANVDLWEVGGIRQAIERLDPAEAPATQKSRDPSAVFLLPFDKGRPDSCLPGLALSPGGTLLGATSTSNLKSFWDVKSGRLIAVVDRPGSVGDIDVLTLGPGDAVLVHAQSVNLWAARITDLSPILRGAGSEARQIEPQREAK